MHPSTIAAILAFAAGTTVNAVPVVRPEGTIEPPADRPRTTLEDSRAQPQLEFGEDELTIPSVEKRDHPSVPVNVCSDDGKPYAGTPCFNPDLVGQIISPLDARAVKRDPQRRVMGDGNRINLGIIISPLDPRAVKRDPQRRVMGDGNRIKLGILPNPILEGWPEGKQQAGFRKERRDPQVIDAGFGFDAGVTIDPSTIAGGLKQLIPGQKEKRDPQVIDAGFGFDAGVTIDPSTIADQVKQFIPQRTRRGTTREENNNRLSLGVLFRPDDGSAPYVIGGPSSHRLNSKRDPQRRRPGMYIIPSFPKSLYEPVGKRDAQIDAGFGFDAGITIDPTTLPGHLTKLLPGQKNRRDAQIDAGFGFDAGITIDPTTLPGHLTKLLPGQKNRRDAQIDAGFGFDAGITIDPTTLPGHLTKLLPGQKNKRNLQNRGKGQVLGKIAQGVAGGIGAIADGLIINQALQGKPA